MVGGRKTSDIVLFAERNVGCLWSILGLHIGEIFGLCVLPIYAGVVLVRKLAGRSGFSGETGWLYNHEPKWKGTID